MVHSQYQHGPRLFFDKGSFFVVLVLLHASPPNWFCSSFLRHSSHPLVSAHVLGVHHSC
jgi:hypothetical protein